MRIEWGISKEITQLVPKTVVSSVERRQLGNKAGSIFPVIESVQPAWVFLAILIAAVSARLIGISEPFIDSWCWRATQVAMHARHFFLEGFNLFWPQIDWAGSEPGYVGAEFPLLPWLAATLYLLFGEHEWIGRLLSILSFALSLPFFFLLIMLFTASCHLLSFLLVHSCPICCRSPA
jgi:4-amino-4-deoxy-L-arabinose transferase-like glycosyltransferase